MFLYCFLLYLNLVFMVGVHDRIPEMSGIFFFLFVFAKIRCFCFFLQYLEIGILSFPSFQKILSNPH